MAEQSRKFGARIAELRGTRKQRDIVAAMAALGDESLNTNQLSRYENGGAMPSEQRQEWFARVLETTVADLHAGPEAERKPKAETPDLFGPTELSELSAAVDELRRELRATRTELLSEIGKARTAREAPQRSQERGSRSGAGS